MTAQTRNNSKIRNTIIILLIFLLAFFLHEYYPIDKIKVQPPKITTQSGIEDKGTLQFYFCPKDNCEKVLLDVLQTAQSSIHCAIYDLDLQSLKQLFQTKATQMDVEIVMDDGYVKKFNTEFTHADKQGEMHDKFCIVDNKLMFTGSANPTNNDAHKNNNNVLVTNIPSLIENYQDEFQELWNGTFKSGKPVQTPLIFVQNTTIQNYFCPEDHCADHIQAELEKAQHSIYFMAFSFTHENIANVLLLKKQDNLTVEGVMEKRTIDQFSQFYRLNQNGISVLKDGNNQTMHHKVFIIDQQTVITGSMNPTGNGDKYNDENVLVIHDPVIAEMFMEEYGRVRGEAGMNEK